LSLSDPAQLIGAESQANGPFNYPTVAAIGNEARQLAVYNWWRYCEQKSAPAWMGDNFGAYEFEYPDGGGGQRSATMGFLAPGADKRG
jgi:hypothetical protein